MFIRKTRGNSIPVKGCIFLHFFLNKHSSEPSEHIQLRFTLTAHADNTYLEESIAMHELTEKNMSCT